MRDILRSLAILAVLVPALAGSAHSATLRVPGEYATIQAGIDAASVGRYGAGGSGNVHGV